MDLNLPKKRIFVGNASLWKRAAAFVLDLFILDFFVFGFYDSLLKKIVPNSDDFISLYRSFQVDDNIAFVLTLLMLIITLLALAYFVLLDYLIGQTFGKMLLGIRTVSVRDSSKFGQVGFFQSLLRNMFIIPAVPFIFLWVIDPLYIFFNHDKQRFSEWLSRTKSIEVYEF